MTPRTLGVNADRIPVWQTMLAKMPEYMINEDGAIKEWLLQVDSDLPLRTAPKKRSPGNDRTDRQAPDRVA